MTRTVKGKVELSESVCSQTTDEVRWFRVGIIRSVDSNIPFSFLVSVATVVLTDVLVTL